MNPIKLGLPKGSLQDSTFALMSRAGWNFKVSSRSYVPTVDDPEIAARLVRPQEIPRYVELGLLDAGITGYDWIYENGADVVEVTELCYSKATSNPVRWVVAVPNDSPIQTVKDLQGKRIATEAVGLTRRYLADHGVTAEIEFSWGATEAKAPELVDAIVELTETGSSLRANQLRILDTVLTSTTRLIANKDTWADAEKRAKIEQLALLLQGALQAENQVLLKMNAKKSAVAVISGILPALQAPTVNTLSDPSWVAIETVVSKTVVREIIPQLKAAGATGIIELALNKVVP
ncbi:MAG TPA: ATP phosphoribosyltransferase [Kiritimatiellia bacterium]|jgi:ATP phosphoribosyltransferase|nr:ATP phosphoribosyltransferase [Lentisphaerota bacterium]HRV31162.1 ATP phosphoribosyltransferase [Kiritimatiellia bacterium]